MLEHLFDAIIVASMGGGLPHAGSSGPSLSPRLGPHCVVFVGRSLCFVAAKLSQTAFSLGERILMYRSPSAHGRTKIGKRLYITYVTQSKSHLELIKPLS